MADLDIFSPHVMPFVIGCPDSMMRMGVLEAAIELCERSGVWAADLPLASVDAQLFTPELPAGARILLIKDVMRNATCALPENAYQVAGDWASITFSEPHLAAIASTFTAKATLVPTRLTASGQPTSELPSVLVERYLQGIAAGAKRYLLALPGQSWSNPTLAGYFEQQFKQACATAAIEAQHGRAANSPRVLPRRFG